MPLNGFKPISDSTLSITNDEFAGLMRAAEPFSPRNRLAVAVSGGPDSTVLFALLRDWAQKTGRTLTVLTVNHGLRPESRNEAEQVAFLCSHTGTEHQVLNWTGSKPRSGIQAAARDARYNLLQRWCIRNDVRELCLGHTLNDQAETFLIRLSRGSGLDGLAAMPLVRLQGNVRIVRPLLGVPRARIVATLSARRLTAIQDKSNEDRRYTRVVIRENTQKLQRIGISATKIADVARIFGCIRVQNEQKINNLLNRSVVVYPEGYAKLDAEQWRLADYVIASRLVAELIRMIGGRKYLPHRQKLNRLVKSLRARNEGSRTLGGCVISVQHENIYLRREHRVIREVIPIVPGAETVWDGRFELQFSDRNPSQIADLQVRALGERGWNWIVDRAQSSTDIAGYREIPGPVRYGLPALWWGESIAEVPHFSYLGPDSMEKIIKIARFRNQIQLQTSPFWVA